MKDNCELCGEPLTDENIHILYLVDDTSGVLITDMEVCDDCIRKFEFTIGAVEWEDQK